MTLYIDGQGSIIIYDWKTEQYPLDYGKCQFYANQYIDMS